MSSIILDSDLPADLLTTNRAPNDGELALARTLIRHLENQLYSPAVGKHDPEGAESNAKQSILDNLTSLNNIVSPIRRVPIDVIQEIFLACIDPNPYKFRNNLPRTLSHISSGLRKIALSTPALWTTLNVQIVYKGFMTSIEESRTLRGQISWLEEVIHHRSGNLSLCLVLDDTSLDRLPHGHKVLEVTQESFNEIINLVLSCHSRWRDIRFGCSSKNTPHVLSFLKSLTPQVVPQLQSIHFGMNLAMNELPELNFFPMAILACPNLKKIQNITLDNFHKHRSYIPLSTITELTSFTGSRVISPSLFMDFASALRLCVSLVRLEFSIYTVYGDTSDLPEDDIYLPCLQHLFVYEKYTNMWRFTSINAPRLQALRLALYRPIGDWRTEKIVEFFKRCPNIQDLNIFGEMRANTVLSILCHCPQLVTLQLPRTITHYADWDGVLLRFVHAGGAEDILCPKLQYLDIDFDHELIVTDFNTLNMLATRKLEPSLLLAPWKRLKIRFRHHYSQSTGPKELLQLANSSSRIIIEYAPWSVNYLLVLTTA